jgi:TolA-binding protein
MFNYSRFLIGAGVMVFMHHVSAAENPQDLESRVASLEARVKVLIEQNAKRADLEDQIMQLKFAMNQSRRQEVTGKVSLKDNAHEHEKLFAEIKQFLAQKDHHQAQFAINRYLSAYGQQSHQYEVKFELANLLTLQGDLLKAEPLYIAVSQQKNEKKAPDALLRLMTIYWQTGQAKKAQATYQVLEKRYPRSPVAQLAKVQYQQWIKSSGRES